jgi:hypothetical protein
MTRQIPHPAREREVRPLGAAKPFWQLSESRQSSAPPRRASKWILAVAVILQMAWIFVLAMIALAK